MLQDEIRRLREAKGYTQKELAELIPMTQHALSQIENGKRSISVELFEEIMGHLEAVPQLKVQDEDIKKKVDLEDYFRGEKGLKRQFPKWDVRNGGGGCYLLTKNFKTLSNENLAVSISLDVAMINKKLEEDKNEEYGYKVLEEYIDFEEWEKNKELYVEFGEFCNEILFYNYGDETKHEPIAKKMFSQKDLDEMKRVSDVL